MLDHAGAPGPTEAALLLCEWLGVTPTSLGWQESAKGNGSMARELGKKADRERAAVTAERGTDWETLLQQTGELGLVDHVAGDIAELVGIVARVSEAELLPSKHGIGLDPAGIDSILRRADRGGDCRRPGHRSLTGLAADGCDQDG